ncbi:MAG TPA: hypothetical protein VJV78_24585, partial [Polyangiales bacterium]|nr:hypothetical protein [Polyangiales bacterium]
RLRPRDDCASATLDFSLPWAPACTDRGREDTRVFNNKLLVSIAQAFGVPIDSFGTQSDGGATKGALSELA